MAARGHRSAGKELRLQIGDAIRALREAHGLSQAELGRKIGTTRSGVGTMEKGANLTLSSIETLARALGVSPAAFFLDAGAPRGPKERRSIARPLEVLRPEPDEVVQNVEAVARTIVKALRETGGHRRGRKK